MVLESTVDHSQDVRGFLRTQAWALQDSFDAFVAWCEDPASGCDLHGKDVRGIWAGLMRRADDGGLGMSAFDLAAAAHGRLAGPDYPGLAAMIESLAGGGPGQPFTRTPVTAVFCADWALPVRDYPAYARLLRRAAIEAPDVRYSAAVLALKACLGWPQPVANPQHVLHVRTRTPVLLINARHDPATGHNWATGVARQLGRHGVLLTYEGAGHGSYNRSECMRGAVDAYLISLTVPRPGASCPAA
jgi:hypothetical protein